MYTYICIHISMHTRTYTLNHTHIHSHTRTQVNKIREVPMYPGVVVTHTDAPELFVWSIDQQPNRAGEKVRTVD